MVTWERLAEIRASDLRTGSNVSIQGRMISRTYTDSTGVQRTIWEVTASGLQLLDRKPLQTPVAGGPTEPAAA